MANFKRSQEVYGVTNASTFLATPPIVSQRAPQSTDGADLGTIWIYEPASAYYILTSVTGGSFTWTAQTSGSGVFPTVDVNGASGTVLTVDTGDTSLGGALTVAGVTTLNGDAIINGDLDVNGDLTYSSNSAFLVTSDANANPSILFATNGGTSEVIEIHNIQGTSSNAIYLLADAGDISIKATASTDATAIHLNAAAGGYQLDAALASQINVTGAAQDLSLQATGGSINLTATESVSDAIVISASGAAGKVEVLGTGGVVITGTNNPVAINSGTGAMNISTDAAATTVSIGTGGAIKGVTVGSTNSSSSTLVQSGSGTLGLVSSSGNVSVGTTNGTLAISSGTGTMSISADAAATTVNIATGGAVKAVTVGSTNTSSSTIIQSGSGNVKLSGGTIRTLTAVESSSTYVVAATDDYIQIDCSGGAIQVNLPNAPTTGRVYTIKDETGSAATHNITVTTVGGTVHIDGSATLVMSTNWQAVRVIFNGTLYLTI